MKIYKQWDFHEDFEWKTPALSWGMREWMDAFLSELGELMYNELGESVGWEGDMRVVPGIEVSGFIPSTNGGLCLTLMAPLEAEADRSHYPPIPCVRKHLDLLTEEMEQDFERVEGVPASDAEHEQYWSFVDSWNESCDCYADYVFEVWQDMDKVHFQAYVSLDDNTCVKNTWYVNDLPNPEVAASDLRGIIMAAWEEKI